jgi:predicted exporter
VIWLALVAGCVWVVARAHYAADMSAFLPASPSPSQQLLVDELREGVASRLVLVAIDGGDAAIRAQLSKKLATRLRADPAFVTVANGEESATSADQDFIFQHRYLLSDNVNPDRFTAAGLRAAIEQSIDSLAAAAGLLARDLLTSDPTGETLQVVEQLLPSAGPRTDGGVWVTRDGRESLLAVQTRAAGSDTDGQEHALAVIREEFDRLRNAAAPSGALALKMSGPGVFAVHARASIIHEAIRLSILSSLLIVALLLATYRSLPTLLLGLLPVATGALAGTAAVALGFGVVHGVTLGFGVTLIGESVDYSIYLLIQARRGPVGNAAETWIRTLWPTVRLGLLTSLCGFASLLPSGFPGLSQLGLYSMAGLVAAALVTRYVLPELLPERWVARPVAGLGVRIARTLTQLQRYRRLLWLVPLVAGVAVFVHRGQLWNRDPAALSPVPVEDQLLDAELRSNLGAPNSTDMVVISAPDVQTALRASEIVGRRLEPLVESGELAGFESPARYLPSLEQQRARRDSLPDAKDLRSRLVVALATLPVRADRLEPFVEAVERARQGDLIERASLNGTSFAVGVDALLAERDGRAVAMLPLRAPAGGPHPLSIDAARVQQVIGAVSPGVSAVVLDIKRELNVLYADYLSEAIRLSMIGFAAIVVMLLATLRSVRRVVRVVAPLALSVTAVIASLVASGRTLTIMHLIGLLLIVAVGSNYALFFDRRAKESDGSGRDTMLASLFIANIATVLGFGTLSMSTVPVLTALGATVAPGAFGALIFSALMADPVPPRREFT